MRSHRAMPMTAVAVFALGLAGCVGPVSVSGGPDRPSAPDPPGLSPLAVVSLSAYGATPSRSAGPQALEPAAGADHGLAVLSFNMKHRDRPPELVLMAQRLSSRLARLPDFILCQEVLFDRSAKKGRDNTAAVLADELGYFTQGTKRASDREGVAIVSRWPFVHYDARHLRARTSALLAGFRRVSIMGEFLVPGVGRVRVVNVHFAYLGFERHIRRKQLTETLRWIAQRDRQVPADVTILGGDFNARPHSKELEPLSDPAITGHLRYENWNTTEPTRGPKGRPKARVDHIFVSAPTRDVRMLGERLLFRHGLRSAEGGQRIWISDHLPLLHEYAVARQPTLAASADALPVAAP